MPLVEGSKEQHFIRNIINIFIVNFGKFICVLAKKKKKINILIPNKKVVYNNYARNIPIFACNLIPLVICHLTSDLKKSHLNLYISILCLLERSKVTCCVLYARRRACSTAVSQREKERFYRLLRVKRKWAFQQSSLECESSMRTVMQCSIQRT